jgi:DNA-binding NarL/FixJ family response regulator
MLSEHSSLSLDGLKVLLVDDDPFTRTSLTALLHSIGCQEVEQCHSVSMAMSVHKTFQAHIAVVDLDLGEGPNGIDLSLALRQESPHLGIVMLSSYESPQYLGSSQPDLPAGTVYLVKRDVSSGDVLASACLASIGVVNESSDLDSGSISTRPQHKFSAIQVDILRLIANGLSNSEIAERLYVSERTVEKNIAKLIKILHLQVEKSHNQRVVLTRAYFELSGIKDFPF